MKNDRELFGHILAEFFDHILAVHCRQCQCLESVDVGRMLSTLWEAARGPASSTMNDGPSGMSELKPLESKKGPQ